LKVSSTMGTNRNTPFGNTTHLMFDLLRAYSQLEDLRTNTLAHSMESHRHRSASAQGREQEPQKGEMELHRLEGVRSTMIKALAQQLREPFQINHQEAWKIAVRRLGTKYKRINLGIYARATEDLKGLGCTIDPGTPKQPPTPGGTTERALTRKEEHPAVPAKEDHRAPVEPGPSVLNSTGRTGFLLFNDSGLPPRSTGAGRRPAGRLVPVTHQTLPGDGGFQHHGPITKRGSQRPDV